MSGRKSHSPVAKPTWKPRAEMTVLNKDQQRIDGPLKVTGRAVYTHDVRLPGMVWARLVLVPIPRATIESIDVEAARAVPGCVLASAYKASGDELAYIGDDSVIAYVAAETEEAAEDAARAVQVKMKPLSPPIVTREQVLADGTPEIAGRAPVDGLRESGDEEDVVLGLSESDRTLESVYELPIQYHVCLETHGHVVDYDGERATIYASTQMVSDSVGQFAQKFGLPEDKVRVVTEHMGGGFGSKFGMGVEGSVACDIAMELKRPVHLMLDRRQEFQMAGNRSGSHVRVKAGAMKDGKLSAISAEIDKLGGVSGGSFPGLPYIYDVKNQYSVTRSVHTATDGNRAMRAPGHPQASFVMESVIDELAYAVSIDPVEFRKLNLEDTVWHRHLDAVAKEIGWQDHPNRIAPGSPDGRGMAEGIGFGVATWRAGGRGGARCEVRINADGSVVSSIAVQDLGTGARTYVAAIPAEEFGLEIKDVTARIGDSALPPGVGSGGSVTTGSVAPAIKAAAHTAREEFEERLAANFDFKIDGFEWSGGRVKVMGAESTELSFKDACALLGGTPITANEGFDKSLAASGRLHGAQAARVRVDTLTGEVQVLKMVAMQDQGLPLNRLALRSQINGGMIQALSYGLLEERVLDSDQGWLLTRNLESYKIAGPKEIPELVVLIDDEDDRLVTGMAEAPVIPGHAAIANAIFNACGARIRSVPFTPDRVLSALA